MHGPSFWIDVFRWFHIGCLQQTVFRQGWGEHIIPCLPSSQSPADLRSYFPGGSMSRRLSHTSRVFVLLVVTAACGIYASAQVSREAPDLVPTGKGWGEAVAHSSQAGKNAS